MTDMEHRQQNLYDGQAFDDAERASRLDGAGDPGNPAAWSATPAEFAARWNALTEAERWERLRVIIQDAEDGQRRVIMARPRPGRHALEGGVL